MKTAVKSRRLNKTQQQIVTDHIAWAEAQARKVAKHYKFGRDSQEEHDLISVAYLALVDKALSFDASLASKPSEASYLLKGYVTLTLSTNCKREARRLRNGGTYNTRQETPGESLAVELLSDFLTEDGDQWEPTDHRHDSHVAYGAAQ